MFHRFDLFPLLYSFWWVSQGKWMESLESSNSPGANVWRNQESVSGSCLVIQKSSVRAANEWKPRTGLQFSRHRTRKSNLKFLGYSVMQINEKPRIDLQSWADFIKKRKTLSGSCFFLLNSTIALTLNVVKCLTGKWMESQKVVWSSGATEWVSRKVPSGSCFDLWKSTTVLTLNFP